MTTMLQICVLSKWNNYTFSEFHFSNHSQISVARGMRKNDKLIPPRHSSRKTTLGYKSGHLRFSNEYTWIPIDNSTTSIVSDARYRYVDL